MMTSWNVTDPPPVILKKLSLESLPLTDAVMVFLLDADSEDITTVLFEFKLRFEPTVILSRR